MNDDPRAEAAFQAGYDSMRYDPMFWVNALENGVPKTLAAADAVDPIRGNGAPDFTMPTGPLSLMQAERDAARAELARVVALLGQRHELSYGFGGDGWNEPFGESWDCSCGEAISHWVQVDPECSGKPELDEVLALHADHVAVLRSAAALSEEETR